jgi:hypothetical protein
MDPIEKARKSLKAARTDDLDVQYARRHYLNAALDCLEALRGPSRQCMNCNKQFMTTEAADTHVNVTNHSPLSDLHAEAWETFKEAIGE